MDILSLTPHCVYALIDPRTEAIRYIGLSIDPIDRLRRHIQRARRGAPSHKDNWIRQLLSLGIKPKVKVLETLCTREEACNREQYLISQATARGWNLTNSTLGGEVSWTCIPEVGRKISERNRGRPSPLKGIKRSEEFKQKLRKPRNRIFSLEERKAIGDRFRGKKLSDEQRRNIGLGSKGHRLTPESRSKISEAAKSQWADPEIRARHEEAIRRPDVRERISAANRGREVSPQNRAKMIGENNPAKRPEVRAKISAAQRGKTRGPISDETRAKLSKAHRGRKLSDETRAKMSEAAKLRVRRKRDEQTNQQLPLL
jgi:hypothetical protein